MSIKEHKGSRPDGLVVLIVVDQGLLRGGERHG
jgi:hypothetical protein